MFSKACEYAIKASIYISKQSIAGKLVNVKEVSENVEAPVAFTAKILQQLSREKILQSTRGKQGGFSIHHDMLNEIKIFDIIKIIDGDDIFTQCGLGLKKCSESNPCPVHQDFKQIRNNLELLTKKYSLGDLAIGTEKGLFNLK